MSQAPNDQPPISFTTEAYANEHAIICPSCGDFYVHPTLVQVMNVQAHLTCEITADGVQTQAQQQPSGRGVVIIHGYRCEAGHSWLTRYTFHKGTVTVETEVEAAGVPTETIWRD